MLLAEGFAPATIVTLYHRRCWPALIDMMALLCLICSLQKSKEATVLPVPVVNREAKAWRGKVDSFVCGDIKR